MRSIREGLWKGEEKIFPSVASDERVAAYRFVSSTNFR